jgi:hypothetical protein
MVTQHNDIQHNDIQHNDAQHNDTRLNDTHHNDIQHKVTQYNGIQRSLKLNITQHNDTQHNGRVSIMLIVNYAEGHYAKCRCTEYRGANCQIANNMLEDHIKVICFNNSYIVSNQKIYHWLSKLIGLTENGPQGYT